MVDWTTKSCKYRADVLTGGVGEDGGGTRFEQVFGTERSSARGAGDANKLAGGVAPAVFYGAQRSGLVRDRRSDELFDFGDDDAAAAVLRCLPETSTR